MGFADAVAYPLDVRLCDTPDVMFLQPTVILDKNRTRIFELCQFARQMSTLCEFPTKQSVINRIKKHINLCIKSEMEFDDVLLDCIAFDNDIDINVMRLWKFRSIKLEFFSYIVRYDEVECYLSDEECDHEGYVMWNKYGTFKIVNRAVFSSSNFRLSKNRQTVKCNPIEYSIIMNRKEYDLVFQALKNYRLYMTKEQEVLSEKILDDL